MGESSVHDRLLCRHQHSGLEVCTVTPPHKLDLDQMSDSNIRILKDTNFGTILMIFVICHKLWMILAILFCDLLWRRKCPRLNFRSPHQVEYYRLSVCFFFFVLLLGLKARVKKKKKKRGGGGGGGEFPPMWCRRSSPKHKLCWGKFVHWPWKFTVEFFIFC